MEDVGHSIAAELDIDLENIGAAPESHAVGEDRVFWRLDAETAMRGHLHFAQLAAAIQVVDAPSLYRQRLIGDATG
ncbi:hypothetical protein D9M71_823800 [compost metagenome]